MELFDFNTDVLTIKCIENFIFLGIGCTLYIINRKTSQVKMKKDILHPDNIHNISEKFNEKLIIHGGKRLCIVQFKIEGDFLDIEKLSEVHTFDDWIIDVKWLGSINDPTISILFAHNNVYNYHAFKKKYKSISCMETCLLYAGMIDGKNYENAVIFSGTVFQEILIWKINNCSDSQFSEILFRLKGHKGVITSIFYSNLDNLIISSSDDRTVRLWKISNDIFSEKNVEISLQTTMYGHSARVWRTILFKNILASIGEDSCICFWNLSGKLLHKVKAHYGAPIWCIDIADDHIMYTGGGDGSVNSWALSNLNPIKNLVLVTGSEKNVPKIVTFLDNEEILILTNEHKNSKLLHFYDDNYKTVNYYNLHKNSTYYIMELSPNKKHIALASIQGEISIYQKSETISTQLGLHRTIGSRIFSLQWLQLDKILICLDNGILCILNFSNHNIKIFARCILPYSRERWTTAGCLHDNILICGDRMGSIHIFDLRNDTMNPLQSFNRVHGRLGVQLCKMIDSNLVTAGRDGTIKYYKFIKNSDEKPSIELLYSKNMPMDWISQIFEYLNDNLVIGFHEENFLVFSMSLKRVVAKIPCGGGHRSWDCSIDNGSIKFIYLQKKKINVKSVALETFSYPQLLTGVSTKEIYCIKKLPEMSQNNHLLVSGGEDCSLRIYFISSFSSGPALKVLYTFDGHLSNIKCLSVFPYLIQEQSNRYLLFSGGGRAQMKVWEVSVKKSSGILRESDVCCKDLVSHMLYGPDDKRNKIRNINEFNQEASPETRYMDLSTTRNPLKPHCVLVFTACSDGYLRIFNYDSSTNEMNLVNTSPYNNRCILQVHSYIYQDKIILLTMSTDGILKFWAVCIYEHELQLDPVKVNDQDGFILHKSGVNSYDIKCLSDGEYLLATGGDDNCLRLMLFKIISKNNQSLSIEIVSNCESSSAHSAQITGLKLTENGKLFSVGVDQKIVVHLYSLNNSIIDLKFLREQVLCISNIQGLSFLQNMETMEELFCIYGKGIQLLKNTNSRNVDS